MVADKKDHVKLLRSPARRTILLYLAQHGPSRFLDIQKGTGLSTGTIYHHIRSLEGYVVQDNNRMYRLTEAGLRLASLLSETQAQRAEEPQDTVVVNDLLLEFYPAATRVASYLGLTPIYRRLGALGTQLALSAACLEFVLLVAPHVYPAYLPAIGVYGFSVVGALQTFAESYLFVRLFTWLLARRGLASYETHTRSPLVGFAYRLAAIVDPELLSMFSLGFCLTYLSFLAADLPLVGQALGLALFFWGYFAAASAISYASGLELIPSLLLPFATDMFVAAIGQPTLEHYFEPSSLAFDLGMGALALLVAAWADRNMKSAFTLGRRKLAQQG